MHFIIRVQKEQLTGGGERAIWRVWDGGDRCGAAGGGTAHPVRAARSVGFRFRKV